MAYLKNIEIAYSPLSLIYNTYQRVARRAFVPAPFVITSTPNVLSKNEGLFFYEQWNSCKELDESNFDFKKLPWEIYEDYIKEDYSGYKVFQAWYEFPGRISNKKLIDKNNPNNIRHILDDPETRVSEIAEYDIQAATWMKETRKLCITKRNIKKDIYCLFINTGETALFTEEMADTIISSIVPPINYYDLKKCKHNARLNFYVSKEYLTTVKNIIISVDPAFSSNGDKLSITVVNFDNGEILGDLVTRTGKVNLIADIVNEISEEVFKNQPIIIERNNFGISVIERIEEKYPETYKRLFWYNPLDSRGKIDKNKRITGINTTSSNRELIINTLLNFVNEKTNLIRSKNVIDELLTLEYKGNKIQAMTGCHDDSVMSYAIALYAREYHHKDLRKFFFDRKQLINNLTVLDAVNTVRQSSNSIDKMYAQSILDKKISMQDDLIASKEMLGEFHKETTINKSNIIDIFMKFNS
jgi:hypothetical protein